jgi:hypothetical protein
MIVKLNAMALSTPSDSGLAMSPKPTQTGVGAFKDL